MPSGGAVDADELGVAVVSIGVDQGGGRGPAIERLVSGLEGAGHPVAIRESVNEGRDRLQRTIGRLVDRDDVRAVIACGGLALSSPAVTESAVRELLERPLPGVGEAVRRRLDGPTALADRSFAGVRHGTVVCCLPADPAVVDVAVDEVVVPALPALVASLGEPGED